MRKCIFLAAATIIAAVTFTSCNNDDKEENSLVRFMAGIDNFATQQQNSGGSRAAETIWGNDAIGIFMTEGSTTHYTNCKYETGGNGTFTAAANNEMYYPMSGNTVNFIAYYPYDETVTALGNMDVEIATNQTIVDVQPAFDLLYSSGATGKKETAATPVELAFDHKLAKLVMDVKADASVTEPLAGMVVSINGMNIKNTFNLSDGTLGAANTPVSIIPRTLTDGKKYDAIIMPDNYAANAVTVKFTLTNSDAYIWTLDAIDFAPGNEYIYTVTLSKTGVKATSTINPWTTHNKGDVTAE